ncbi:MAG: hypothetical protein PHC91_03730 [Eubacteriales bacterium]|nr:hypothetical protein [Eubacteriales bacterium]
MKELNLCIDIDGTVTEPYYWLERANRYFDRQLKPEDITAYEIHRMLDVEEGDYSEFYDLYGKLLHRESKARFRASEAIQSLYQKHMIHFVTAREEKMRDTSIEWLARHHMPMDSISLLGSHYKADKAKELNSDLFIEDCYSNALQLSRAGFDVLLIDCTYNKGLLPQNVTRVKNWSEILDIVDRKAKLIKTVS